MMKIRLFILIFIAVCLWCTTSYGAEVDSMFTRMGASITSANVNLQEIKNLSVTHEGSPLFIQYEVISPKVILAFFDWKEFTEYTFSITDNKGKTRQFTSRAPVKPEPYELSVVDLGSIQPGSALGGGSYDTFVSFSADERYLAVGTRTGDVRVYELPDVKKVFEKHIYEGIPKCGAFDSTSSILYIGEQSPDAAVIAYNFLSGKELWRYNASDDVGSTRPDNPSDLYAMYQFPGIFGLKTSSDGRVFANVIHSWFDQSGRYSRSSIYCFNGRTGALVWKFPGDEPMEVNAPGFDVSSDGKSLAFVTTRQVPTTPEEPFQRGTLYFLNAGEGQLLWHYIFPPLVPYFQEVFVWQVFITGDGTHTALALGDGRVYLFANSAKRPVEPVWEKNIGTPMTVGGIPITTTSGWPNISKDKVYCVVNYSDVTPSVKTEGALTTQEHPNANNLFVYDFTGKLLWKWPTGGSTQGIFIDDDGRFLVLPNGQHNLKLDVESFGCVVFDEDKTGSGIDKYLYQYQTAGPCITAAISPRGTYIAVIEVPILTQDGKNVLGKYALHIIH